ncbi:fimbrillin family protein [Sphingobacterium spiritivorum]|uniref:fimbrillin family protein n=1 Tax=Sphingobacterium spiritivorum TaxID=258 RepID=UPI003DA4D185
MKTLDKKASITAAFLLCSLLILSGCAKKDVTSDVESQLSFAVTGIEEARDANPTKNRAALAGENTTGESQILKFGNFSAEVSVTSAPIKTATVSDTEPHNSKQRAAQEMTDGYKYRVVVLDAHGNWVGAVQATAKTDGSLQTDAAKIDVVKGGTYYWYAYSYNESADVPVLTNEINPVFTPSYDKDLLYAQGTVTAGTGAGQQDRQIPITFKHALAKVTVRVDASMRNEAITALSAALASNNYFSSGAFSLNVLNGTASWTSGNSHTTPATIPFADFSVIGTATGSIRQASFYTMSTTAINPFVVNISQLRVGVTDLISTSTTVNFNSIKPAIGKEIIANIRIQPNGGITGNLLWARGNLYYQGGQYLIRPDDTTPRPFDSWYNSDFWAWGATLPYTDYSNNGAYVDACAKVLPANTWRMPSRADFNQLISITGVNRQVAHRSTNGGYVRFKGNNNVWVQFNLDGRKSFQYYPGGDGNYWTSDRNSNGYQFYGFEVSDNIADAAVSSLFLSALCCLESDRYISPATFTSTP